MIPASSAFASVGTFRTTGDVNLRSEPSTDATVITIVYNNSSVEVLNHDPAGWSRVQVGSSTGYIRSDFLKFPINNFAHFRTTDGVNMRSAASTDSRIIDTLITGTTVDVLEHNPAGWSKVRYDGSDGFIRSDFLVRGGNGGSSTTSSSSSSSGGTVISTVNISRIINFRSGPSTDTDIIRQLSVGTIVEILENRADGWSKVRQNGTEGFIRSDLLTEPGSNQAVLILKTNGNVRLRKGPSTDHDMIELLPGGTNVEVVEQRSDGWSSVKYDGKDGFIRSDLLSASGSSSTTVIATLKTVTGVNFRTGPSQTNSIIRVLPVNTSVDVFENLTNGWSRVRHNGTTGYIKSEYLGTGPRVVELVDWSEARNLVPTGVNLRVVDVRTGITFSLRGFAKSGHIDVEPPTVEDTNAILRSRNGVWAWAPRPVWVTVGDRTFAASLNGMPHDVSTISNNGMNGHLCLHFNNTVTNSKTYQRDLNNAVVEAYNAR